MSLPPVPHRPPFLQIDRVVARAPGRAVTERLATAHESFGAAIVLECMAQACACASEPQSGGDGRGLLVAVADFALAGAVASGDRLTTTAVAAGRLGRLVRFQCTTRVDGRELARAELSVRVPARD
jgi:3-hydroxymyristoyl/3-hydroxydecanoyl-(acyl carrier protein) dehydratase